MTIQNRTKLNKADKYFNQIGESYVNFQKLSRGAFGTLTNIYMIMVFDMVLVTLLLSTI